MIRTSLCYIIKDNQVLMLYRDKNPNDPNYLKWIGIGGKCKDNESVETCMLREVKEETDLSLTQYTYRGIIHFISNIHPNETMHLYTASSFIGALKPCDEGTLKWVDKNEVLTLPMWEGDHHFLSLINDDSPFFTMTLTYDKDRLTSVYTEYNNPQ